MDRNDVPKSFGVIKPVGHVVVAFPSAADAEGASRALAAAGFPQSDIHSFTPEEIVQRADADIASAGVLASIGQELNLVKAHRELALTGHSFLIVKAEEDDRAWQVADISRQFHAVRAQKYGRLIIEELIEPGSGEKQVAESPDRGLDPQTRSGNEQTAAEQKAQPPSPLEGDGQPSVSTEQVAGR